MNKKLTRRQKGGNKKILTIELGEGLGNRIFKILAGLGFAEKWNMDFCIVKSHILDNDHSDLEESINHIKTLFPNVPILDISSNFPIEYREKERYIYEDFPKPNDNTILYGTFQSEKYFSDKVNINIPVPNNSILENINKENLYFIQFRLDDYLNYSETNLNLVNYYKYCINEIKSINPNVSFLILSKNIDDAKKYINDNLNDVLHINTLIFDPNTSRLDSLYYMSKCKGAIIPNSTFAWFGAYLSGKEKVYFPKPWMSSLIKDKDYDIYPDWATVVDIDIKTGGKKSMKAYVINLDERPEKWERIQNDFKDTDIEVERFAAIKHENGHIGCGLTHVALVKMAKEKGLDSILIIEDDCKLTKNFNNRWATIKKYLDENKDNWDIFNGGVVWPTNPTPVANLEPDIKLIQSNGPGCRYAHFVYVNKSGYTKAIEWEPMVMDAIKDGEPFVDPKYDSWINEFPRFRNVLMSEGAIAVQYSGVSNTNFVDKNLSNYTAEQESMIIGGDICNINFFTVSTADAPELKRLVRSAEIKGWKVDVLGKEQNRKNLGWEDENKKNGTKGTNYGDFSLKLNGLNDYMKDKKDDDIVLWTDAWDVVALDTCQVMYDKYVKFNKPIVFSAEKACSPDSSKRDLYDTLDTKFPFLCAGMFIGKVKELKHLMTFYKGEKMNDQLFWTEMYLNNKDLIALDNNAEIFLSTWDTDGKYYEFKDNRFTYTDTSTSPVFIHANGNIKDKLKLFEDYFNLTVYKGYVVNIEERTSKWEQIQEDFKNTNFFLERFNAIKDEEGHKGCGKSYQAIIRIAKEKNMDSVFIFDDDCKPLDNFNERWVKVKKWLDDNSEKWEIFNGGLKVVHGSETNLIDTIDESNKIYSIHKGINTHMMLYKKEAYDRMLEWDYDKNWLIDFNYINTNKFKTIYVEPALTVQRDGFSNTEKINKENQLGGKKKTNKRKTIKKKQIIKGGNQDKIEYITVSTKDKPELQKLLTTGKKFGWNIKVLGLELNRTNLGWLNNGNNNKDTNGKQGNFSMKLSYPKQFLENIDPHTIVVISDAWDAYVLGTPEEMIKRYKKFNKDIVISGENNCSPDPSKAYIFEDLKNDPFPYLCSGGIIGKAGTIKKMLEPYNNEKVQDQAYWRDIYEKNKDKITIDSKAEIFLSMHATKAEDYDFTNDIFTYKPTNTQPLIVHGNGDGKDRLQLFERYYKSQNGGDKTVHYITVSTKDTPELQRLIKSAKKYGWNLEVLGLDLDTTNLGHSKGGKFGMKLRYPKEYLKDKNDNDILLFSDAWDVMVLDTPEQLINKYKSFNKDIVISAENACWPDGSRELEYLDTKNEPFPYLNSGGYVGKVGTLKQIFNNYNDDDIDDQRFWTDMYFKNRDKIVLDSKAVIFLSMHDVKQEDFQFDNEKFTYKETGTNPILVHGNGTSKSLLDIFTSHIQFGGNKNMLIMILEHGLGNRFFQIMAGYGFAEKWNMDLYFKNVGNNHISDDESNKEILQLFPNIRFLDDSIDISNFKRMGEITDINDISDENPNENYVMSGLFHKIKYFPKNEIRPVLIEPLNNIIKDIDKSNLFFIHFRFGDYEKDRPMDSLVQYFKKSISLINKDFNNSKYIIISDEIDKAKSFIDNNLTEMLENKLVYDIGDNRLDSLYYMSKCRGGIISNSTYSWFGAYCIENKNAHIYMPEPWVENNDNHYFDNIYPPWCTKISRYGEGGKRKIRKTRKNKKQKGGNILKIINLTNAYHLGDHLFTTIYLLSVKDYLIKHNIEIHYYIDEKYINELNNFITIPNIKLFKLSDDMPKDTFNVWIGNTEFKRNYDVNIIQNNMPFNDFLVDFFTEVGNKIGLPPITEFKYIDNDLIIKYNILNDKYKGCDILIINGRPYSGQYNYDENKNAFDNLIRELSKEYKIVTTEKVDNIVCSRDDNLSVKHIAAISTHVKYIIAINTGPIVSCFNTYAFNNVKKWFVYDNKISYSYPNFFMNIPFNEIKSKIE